MMWRNLRLLFLCLTVIVVTACASSAQLVAGETPANTLQRIADRGELVVGMAGSMPPLNMTTKDGELIGMEVDIAKAMAESMGVKANIKTMPFADLLGALGQGDVDIVMSNMTITPQRNLKYAFAGPYLISGKCLLTKQETLAAAKDTAQINSPDTKLAALAGSTSEELAREGAPQAQLTTVKDYDEGVQMVIDGTVHAMIADYPLCAVSNLRYPEAGFVSAFSLLSYEPLGVALPANDSHMLNWLQNYFGALEGSGVLALLKLSWLEDDSWIGQLK